MASSGPPDAKRAKREPCAGIRAERVRMLSKPAIGRLAPGRSMVLYWMSRDQRAADNWAALHARSLAAEAGGSLVVAFNLVPSFLGATYRHFHFMLTGLAETEATLRSQHIAFHLLRGQAENTIPALAGELSVAAVVCDFCPLRVPAAWAASVAAKLDALGIPLHQVCEMQRLRASLPKNPSLLLHTGLTTYDWYHCDLSVASAHNHM